MWPRKDEAIAIAVFALGEVLLIFGAVWLAGAFS